MRKYIFNNPLLLSAGEGAQLHNKAPRQEARLGTCKHNYLQSLPPPLAAIFTLICWVDLWWPTQVCWPLTNHWEARGGIHYSVNPLKNSQTPTQSLRDYSPSKARGSQGSASQRRSATARTCVFYKHPGSKHFKEVGAQKCASPHGTPVSYFILLWAGW